MIRSAKEMQVWLELFMQPMWEERSFRSNHETGAVKDYKSAGQCRQAGTTTGDRNRESGERQNNTESSAVNLFHVGKSTLQFRKGQ